MHEILVIKNPNCNNLKQYDFVILSLESRCSYEKQTPTAIFLFIDWEYSIEQFLERLANIFDTPLCKEFFLPLQCVWQMLGGNKNCSNIKSEWCNFSFPLIPNHEKDIWITPHFCIVFPSILRKTIDLNDLLCYLLMICFSFYTKLPFSTQHVVTTR